MEVQLASSDTAVTIDPLPADRLRRRTQLTKREPAQSSTVEFDGLFGQERAREAIQLATGMSAKGFNLFVAAPPGADASAATRTLLEKATAKREKPDDWVYVFNFDVPHKPRAIRLPPGRAMQFRGAVRDLIFDLIAAVPAAFEKPEFQVQREALEDEFQNRKEDAFEKLGKEGRSRDVAIIQTPMGFSLAPLKNGEVLDPKSFNALTKAEQKRRQGQLKEVQDLLADTLRHLPKWERETRKSLSALERETAEAAITQSIEETKASLRELPTAVKHLDAMHQDLVDNIVLFSTFAAQSRESDTGPISPNGSLGPLERYDVNIFVAHDEEHAGAPVVEEVHPTLANLVGRVEHRAEAGVLTTSFMLIKPGALHMANGGYLIIDARSLFREPLAWDALKRCLRQSGVKIESLGEVLNLSTTITLDPEPIPIDLRVILVGDAWMHHVLAAYDPDFSVHFKLLADFETDAPRSESSESAYAAKLSAHAEQDGLLPPDNTALERLVEEAARSAGDADRLSLVSSDIRDLMIEASHRASVANRVSITQVDVAESIDSRRRRLSRISDRMQEGILRDIALIDTDGMREGQANCLSLFQIGGFMFGKPTRVTARVRPGSGRIIDIEREATLGGPIHSKGVMILTGYMAGRYAADKAMSLHASLVFEQSYGGIEGDSASLGELCVLLSGIAGVPLKQSFGITGSVNQHGEVQAIGGVNEKIEGFFDICKGRGLTGDQGVIIPESNVQHLMLNEEVVEACRTGRFGVYPVRNVDEAVTLLAGVSPEIFHDKVDATLSAFAKVISKSDGKGVKDPASPVSAKIPPSEPPGAPPENPPSEPPRAPPSRSSIAKKSDD